MMTVLDIILALALGIWLALVNFGVQWFTLAWLVRAWRPSTVLLAGVSGRTAAVAYCLSVVGQRMGWVYAAVCAAGFFAMRGALIRMFDLRSLLYEAVKTKERIWQR
jgi:hypothetical protein